MHDPVLFFLSLFIPFVCIIITIGRHIAREEKKRKSREEWDVKIKEAALKHAQERINENIAKSQKRN